MYSFLDAPIKRIKFTTTFFENDLNKFFEEVAKQNQQDVTITITNKQKIDALASLVKLFQRVCKAQDIFQKSFPLQGNVELANEFKGHFSTLGLKLSNCGILKIDKNRIGLTNRVVFNRFYLKIQEIVSSNLLDKETSIIEKHETGAFPLFPVGGNTLPEKSFSESSNDWEPNEPPFYESLPLVHTNELSLYEQDKLSDVGNTLSYDNIHSISEHSLDKLSNATKKALRKSTQFDILNALHLLLPHKLEENDERVILRVNQEKIEDAFTKLGISMSDCGLSHCIVDGLLEPIHPAYDEFCDELHNIVCAYRLVSFASSYQPQFYKASVAQEAFPLDAPSSENTYKN